MASIEDCTLGTRVERYDGWGGPASIIGRRMNNRAEGYLAESPHKEAVGRAFPDVVLMQFEVPVWSGPNHKVLAANCECDDLTILSMPQTYPTGGI